MSECTFPRRTQTGYYRKWHKTKIRRFLISGAKMVAAKAGEPLANWIFDLAARVLRGRLRPLDRPSIPGIFYLCKTDSC